MKKLGILTLVISLSLVSQALSAKAHGINDDFTMDGEPQLQQQKQEKTKESVKRYNFSLFKIFAPTTIQKKDTLNNSNHSKLPPKDETVYENPRTFFKFS